MRRSMFWAGAPAMAALLLTGCGAEEGATVEMGDNWFEPEALTIAAGEPVTFLNIGQVPHNAFDVAGAWATEEFIASGESGTITIEEPGTYTFYCTFHAPADASAGMVAVLTVTGDGSQPVGPDAEVSAAAVADVEPVEPTGVVRRVPDEYPTIQSGVDAAQPGDLVLVAEGVYREQVDVATEQVVIRGADRNRVVIDGEFERPMGIIVTADGVAIENMTVRSATSNGFYWTGVAGYRGSYLTAINNGTYGIYSFDSADGVFEHSYASGSADGGFYVGQCEDCRAILNQVTAEWNAFGYSGTNSSNSVYLVNSTWRYNGAGIVPNTLDSQRYPPSRGVTIAGNIIESNGNLDAPVARVTWPAVGNGILLVGGNDHVVRDNVVRDHPGYGIAVSPSIDRNFWPAGGNEIRGNLVHGSGQADLAVIAPSRAGGDCFTDNDVGRTLPRMLRQARPCEGLALPSMGSYRHTLMLAGNFAQFPGERLPQDMLDVLPEPGDLEQLPGGADAPVVPAVDVFATYDGVDLGAISRPRVEGEAPDPGSRALLVAGFPVTEMGAWQAYFAVAGWLLPVLALLALATVAIADLLRRADLTGGRRGAWLAVVGLPALLMLVSWWPVAIVVSLAASITYLLGASMLSKTRRGWIVAGGLGTVFILTPALVVAGAVAAGLL